MDLQTYQDVEIDYSAVLTAKEARKKLEGEIAVRGIKVNFDVQSADDELEHPKAETMTKYNKLDQNSSTIGNWVDDQVARAKKTRRDGEELNPFFLPKFIDILLLRAKEFPLWTSVGMDCTSHATSSYVEGYFNDIKTRILKTGPMRVDKFLIKHAHDIHGATLLFSSSMINFNIERCVQKTGDGSPLIKEEKIKINKPYKRCHKLHSTPKDTDKNSLESSSENQRKFNDLLEQCAEQKTEMNNGGEENIFDESIWNNFEKKEDLIYLPNLSDRTMKRKRALIIHHQATNETNGTSHPSNLLN